VSIDYNVPVVQSQTAVVPSAPMSGPDPLVPRPKTVALYTKQNPSSGVYDPSSDRNYTVQIFRTCRDVLYAQYITNMITPIQYRTYFDCDDINCYVNNNNTEGVYIIESYSLLGVSTSETEDFLNYYNKTKGLPYDSDISESIKETIFKHRTKRNHRIDSIIRVVTYISADIIRSNQFTYVTGPGIVLIDGCVPEDLYHPYSIKHLKDSLLSNAKEDGCVTIDITIIDSDNKPYYYMLGNTVESIRPVNTRKGSVLPKGAAIVIRRGDKIIREKSVNLENFEDNGFYRSKELCATKGNIQLAADERKHNVELTKLEYELSKLKEANNKLILERETRILTNELDINKRTSDLEYHKAAKEIDLRHTASKSVIELGVKRVDIKNAELKGVLDAKKYEIESMRSRDLHRIKMVDSNIKLLCTVLSALIRL